MKRQLLKTFFLFLLLVLLSGKAYSQYYITGQEPAATHWMQIKTPQFRIIFPKGYDSIAQYYVQLLKASAPHIRSPYIKHVRLINIVLHNESTVSNAFVNPAPFHANFFETPAQDIYPQRWTKQLTLHEFRHVVQMNMMRTGFGKVMYFLFGQQGNAVQYAGLPPWFYEGDAVYSETIHSRSGRGRLPDFVYPLKAQVLDKKIYTYDKAQFGSYKDFVPDHYTLGYQLVLNGIQHYGINLWKQVILQVARKPYTLFPFSLKLHQMTGMGKVRYYNHTLLELKKKWQSADQHFKPGDFKTLPVKNKYYTSYLFACPTKEGIIYEKTGLDDINRFVLLTQNGKEQRLFTPGFDYKESLSANDSLLVWNEMTFDPRWSNRNYSDIFMYNYLTEKKYRITKKGRYFAPALSPDGKTIVAVGVNEQQHYSLAFIDVKSHTLLHSLRTKDNLFFMTPKWSANGKYVVAAVLGDKGKSVFRINARNLSVQKLLPFSFTEIKEPALYGDWLVYTGTYEGKDNLYALQTQTGKTYKLLGARFGARSARFSPNGKKIYFSNYTAAGFQPAVMNFDTTKLVGFNTNQQYQYQIQSLVTPNTFILDDTTLPKKVVSEKKYKRAGHLLNPYSWGPFSLDLNNYNFSPGFSILSQNDLSTAVTSLGYAYNLNEQTGKWKFSFDYYGWYPVIGVSVTNGNRRAYVSDSIQTNEVRWNETNVSVNLQVPLNLSNGKWIRGLQPYVGWDYRFMKTKPGSNYHFTHPGLSTFTSQLYFYNHLKQSPKDIYPQWGQSIRATYKSTLSVQNPATQVTLQGRLYLPGFVKHQGVSLSAGYEHNVTGDYYFQNLVPVPRGYANLFFKSYISTKADYVLPVVYPDWNISGISYLKRIYADVFYDYMKTTGTTPYTYSSSGAAFMTNWNFLSLFPDVSLGVRWNYRIEQKNSTFDYLFSIRF